ncbi:MAG: acyl-CoA desaturase [Candidatus Roizmanbacteria bacterium]
MAIQLTTQLVKLSGSAGPAAYNKLRKEVTDAKILEKSYIYYSVLIISVVLAMIASLFFLFHAETPVMVVVFCIILAIVTIQCTGIVHDAGHRAIAKSTLVNDIIGHIFAFSLATLFQQWRPSHDKHHAHTNEHDEDPDINIPLLSFTVERAREKKGWQKLLLPYQAYVYFPFGSLVWISMRINNIRYLHKKPVSWAWYIELTTWLVSIGIWFVLPFLLFPLWKSLLIFFVLNWTMGLYVLHVFAPNHKGMPEVARGTKISFFEQQIVTSRNVTASPLVDFLYLGLNYQIEHHLFPSCPRNKQPQLAQIVKRYCKEYGFDYEICTPLQVDRIILKELALVSSAYQKNS